MTDIRTRIIEAGRKWNDARRAVTRLASGDYSDDGKLAAAKASCDTAEREFLSVVDEINALPFAWVRLNDFGRQIGYFSAEPTQQEVDACEAEGEAIKPLYLAPQPTAIDVDAISDERIDAALVAMSGDPEWKSRKVDEYVNALQRQMRAAIRAAVGPQS